MDATHEAARLICEVYRHHPTGGTLHIVLDDRNLDDGYLDWCATEIRERFQAMPWDDGDGSERKAAELACYAAMRALSEPERRTALAIHLRTVRLSAAPRNSLARGTLGG